MLKRVPDAIRDNDKIRGIIRGSGCNQNGRTPSINLPDPVSQLTLIRETYAKSELSMKHTRFFKSHGTITIVDNPNEAKALGEAFREFRTNQDPPQVGAIKSHIGYVESTSGIAVDGAYTSLWTGFSNEVTTDDGGKHVMPWGKWQVNPRPAHLEAIREGGGGKGYAKY